MNKKKIAIQFWKGAGGDCWIYPVKTEKHNMHAIIEILKKTKSSTICNLASKIKSSTITTSAVLRILLVLRVVRVQQHRDARIWSLTKDWKIRLDKSIVDLN